MTSVPPFARPQLATKRQQEQERPGHSFPQKRLQLGEEPTKSRGSEPFGEKDLERRDLLNLSTYEYGNSKESHSDALDRLAPDASQTDSIVCYGRVCSCLKSPKHILTPSKAAWDRGPAQVAP